MKRKQKCNIKKQLEKGFKVEMEHSHLFPKSKQKSMARKIALDHIKEMPCYYKELEKMEKRLKLK